MITTKGNSVEIQGRTQKLRLHRKNMSQKKKLDPKGREKEITDRRGLKNPRL